MEELDRMLKEMDDELNTLKNYSIPEDYMKVELLIEEGYENI